MSDISDRKDKHLELALQDESQGRASFGRDFLLPYSALPEINFSEVDTATRLLGKKINQPLIIASMTGGATHALTINSNLAKAAEKMKVALAVGSQRVALENPEAKKSFEVVRKNAPNTVIFANMGAVQLNYGMTVRDFQTVVKMVGADGLYLHVNPIQEAMQPNGDTNFEKLLVKIEKLVAGVGVPLWVKEVGCGLDVRTTEKLVRIGVQGIDSAGSGGTSWPWIEGKRLGNENLTKWFADYGLPTEESLRRIVEVRFRERRKFAAVASGGIRNPIQALKARLMGADYYSAARVFLTPAMESSEAIEKLVKDWEKGLKIALFGAGVKNWEEAAGLNLTARYENNS
jgi:isopentenyl-diphosphate Delta-isomerase